MGHVSNVGISQMQTEPIRKHHNQFCKRFATASEQAHIHGIRMGISLLVPMTYDSVEKRIL